MNRTGRRSANTVRPTVVRLVVLTDH